MANAHAGTLPSRDLTDRELLERFVAHRDEAAFAGLVQRHGKIVWGVCRRVLHQQQDAEDAFQAVFLLLSQRAGSIRKAEAVGSWLYGVAYRTARKARRVVERRVDKEPQATEPAPGHPAWVEAACRELQRLLDEEVQLLAAKYRTPFVLCCLEGMSRGEAARELGWKEGTVSSRLAQARKLLQTRLARRGVTLTAALTALAVSTSTAAAQASPPLMNAAALTPAARALADQVRHGMDLARLKGWLLLLLPLASLLAFAALPASPPKKRTQKVQVTALERVVRGAAPAAPQPGARAAVSDGPVWAVAFSPDSRRLVTAGGQPDNLGQLKILAVPTALELGTLQRIPAMRAVAFAPDGQVVASGEFGGAIRLRDPASGQERATLPGHDKGVNALAFSPDGATLLSAGSDRAVKLWDPRAGQLRQALHGHTDAVMAAAFFRHARAVVSGSRDGTARVWDVEAGKELFTLGGHPGGVETVAISPDDKLVATAGWDRAVRLWDAATGKEEAVLQGQKSPVLALAFSPRGGLLAGAAADGRVHLWEVKARRWVKDLERQSAPIRALAFSPDGKWVATGSSQGPVLMPCRFSEAAGTISLQTEAFQEYYQPFRGNPEGLEGLELLGPGGDRFVHLEPGGLRITLPAGNPGESPATGVSLSLVVQGDFELTVAFELLKEPQAADAGPKTRVSLEAYLDRPDASKNRASLRRLVSPRGTLFQAWQLVQERLPGAAQTRSRSLPTQANTGRLRLARTGSLLAYSFADGVDGEFILFRQLPFGADDLKEVRVIGTTGGPSAALDVRVTDWRIRAAALPNLPAASAPRVEVTAAQEGRSASGLLGWGMAAGLAALLGGWFYVYRLRR